MRPRLVIRVLVASLLAASCLLARPALATTVPNFGHVFVIVGENKSLYQLNSTNASYIMNTLKPQSAWMSNYYQVSRGSLADYVGLTSGQFAPCEAAGPCGAQAVPSIFSQLGDGAWRDWNESMPSNCYANNAGSTTSLNAYKPGHNPVLYYTGLPCSTYDVPTGGTGPNDMSAFNSDLASGAVPKYNFISPNLCEDSYQVCNGANIVSEYDNFLRREIPLIEASPAFGSDGVIFVTYDEGNVPANDPTTMMAIVGPQVQPGSYSERYDHYSTLATIEAGLGVPCLANACAASTMAVFGAPTSSPSITITQPSDGQTVSGQVSVAGTATAQGGASISGVHVSVDNGTPQMASGTSSWASTIDTTSLPNGRHTIVASATDTNNLTADASITINVGNSGGTSCPAVASGVVEYSGNVSVESDRTGWTGVYNTNSTVARVEPAHGSYDGLWALQIGIKSGSGQGGVKNQNPVWLTSTTAGTIYTAGSFVAASAPGESVSLMVTEKTSGGVVLGSRTITVALNDTNWHQITDAYTARGSADSLTYTLHVQLASTAQSLLADCLSLQGPHA